MRHTASLAVVAIASGLLMHCLPDAPSFGEAEELAAWDDFATSYPRSACEAAELCGCAEYTYASRSECERALTSELDSFKAEPEASGLSYNANCAQEVLRWLQTAECQPDALLTRLDCDLFRGSVPKGGECVSTEGCTPELFCQPTGHDASDKRTCRPLYEGSPGAPCSHGDHCADGLYCIAQICDAQGARGESCDVYSQQPCVEGLACVQDTLGNPGCQTPGVEGGPCANYSKCAEHLYCRDGGTDGAGFPLGTCHVRPKLGEACEAGVCEALSRCADGVCQAASPGVCDMVDIKK